MYILIFSSLSLSDIIPESKLRARNASISEKDEHAINGSGAGGAGPKRAQHLSETSDGGSTDSSTCDYYLDEAEVLQEMFPDTAYVEVGMSMYKQNTYLLYNCFYLAYCRQLRYRSIHITRLSIPLLFV